MCFLGGGTHITRDMCFQAEETQITRDMCFPFGGTRITRDMCLPFGAIQITRDMCFPGGGTRITGHMCFPGGGTRITRDMYLPGGGTILTTRFPWVHGCVHHSTRVHRVSWMQKLSKRFPSKNASQYPWLGEEMRDWPCLKDLTVNQCAVLWCGRDLWVETTHSHLPCFALWRKTTPNKQRAAKPYKMVMNWAPVTQEKQQQAQVDVSTIYIYIHAHISTF